MDARDVRIFCEVALKNPSINAFRGRDVSPSEIGKALKLDEKTVRVRIRRMEEDGFIKTIRPVQA
jgi:DNA-binding Lrp family transcriptional regulator